MSDALTAVLVIEFPAGLSPEGAEHTLKPARAALNLGGAYVTAEALGVGDPYTAGLRTVEAFWSAGQTPPVPTFNCACGYSNDLAAVVAHTKTCPAWLGA